MVAIPIIVDASSCAIHRHYRKVRAVLRHAAGWRPTRRPKAPCCCWSTDLGPGDHGRGRLPARGAAGAVVGAVRGGGGGLPGGARRLGAERAEARVRWRCCRGADDHLVRAVRGYIRTVARKPEDFVTVVIPEAATRRTVAQFLVHREAFLLKTALLFEPGVVVTDVPLVPGEPRRGPDNRPLEPARSVVLIPVSAVHDRHRPRGGLCEVAAPDDDRGHLSGDRSGGDRRRDRGVVRPADRRAAAVGRGAVPRSRRPAARGGAQAHRTRATRS